MDNFQVKKKKKDSKWSSQEFQLKKEQFKNSLTNSPDSIGQNAKEVMLNMNKRTLEISQQEKNAGVKIISGDFDRYYSEESYLGQGTSAIVKKVRSLKTQQCFAAKIIKTVDEETIFNIKFEFVNVKRISKYDKIVQVYELYIDLDHGMVYTIMEYVNGMELFEKLQSFPNGYSENQARLIFVQILLGIKYLHDVGVCHRDIKPNNILVCVNEDGEDQVKITDFNVSKFCQNYKSLPIFKQNKIKMWTYTGTIAFTAPEMFAQGEYTESIDMWSAGCVLFAMLSGCEPFQGEFVADLIENIKNQELKFPPDPWNNISKSAKDLIIQLLKKDRFQRISVESALMHPWISNFDEQTQNTNDSSFDVSEKKIKLLGPHSGHLIKNLSSSNQFISECILDVCQYQSKSQHSPNPKQHAPPKQDKIELKYQRSLQFLQPLAMHRPFSSTDLGVITSIASINNLQHLGKQQKTQKPSFNALEMIEANKSTNNSNNQTSFKSLNFNGNQNQHLVASYFAPSMHVIDEGDGEDLKSQNSSNQKSLSKKK